MTDKVDKKRRGADPLVIVNRDGDVEAVLACNEKSRSKSLEQNELWVVRTDNGRVLPWRGGGVPCGTFTLHDGDGEPLWFQVRVEAPGGAVAPDVGPDAGQNVGQGVGQGVGQDAGPDAGQDATGDPAKASATTRHHDPVPDFDPARTIPVLSPLADVIAERHRTMPEGSYTTHLFSRGASKIRKKTGEEAMELILAETRDDIVAETADLIYHAMVLLEQESIRIEEVLAELKRRHER